MKKIIYLFAFVTVLVTCSCSNNYYYNESQVPNNVVVSENEIETVKQLQIYNDSLKETTSVKFTRGWGTRWSVAAADGLAFINSFKPLVKAGRRILALTGGSGLYWVAGGVFLGTVFMTGGASYGAYQSAHNGYSIYEGSMDYLDQTYENSNHLLLCDDFLARIDSMAILNDSITVVNDSLFAYAGALHNDILESILPQNNANINSIILPPIIDPINISPTINNYGCALLSDQETIDSLIMITDDMSYLYDYDIDEQLDYNEDKGDISSNTKTVLSLFFDAYFGYANSLNDVNNIVSYYHDIVSSSNELTQTEKICILMCIEITKYSYSFWQDYGLQ